MQQLEWLIQVREMKISLASIPTNMKKLTVPELKLISLDRNILGFLNLNVSKDIINFAYIYVTANKRNPSFRVLTVSSSQYA